MIAWGKFDRGQIGGAQLTADPLPSMSGALDVPWPPAYEALARKSEKIFSLNLMGYFSTGCLGVNSKTSKGFRRELFAMTVGPIAISFLMLLYYLAVKARVDEDSGSFRGKSPGFRTVVRVDIAGDVRETLITHVCRDDEHACPIPSASQ